MVKYVVQNRKTVLALVLSVLLASLTCVADLRAQIREDEVDFQTLATVTYQNGNSLWSLAEKYYGNPRLWPLISDMNRISDESDIPVGARIHIPVRGARRVSKKPLKAGDPRILTTVVYGADDSLWGLAEKHYGEPRLWPRIAEANGISDETDIPIGSVIHIPARSAKRLRSRITEANRSPDRMEIPVGGPIYIPVEDAKRTAEELVREVGFEVMAIVFYRKGDTLWSLAERYYGNPWLWPYIADANGIPDVTDISVGASIYIPVEETEISASGPETPVKELIQATGKTKTGEAEKLKPMTAPPSKKQVATGITDVNVWSLEEYKSVGANNLFRRMGWRRAKPGEPPYILVGVAGSDKGLKALVRDEREKNSYYVSEGDSVGEAKIIKISTDHVILSHEGKHIRVGFGERPPATSGSSSRGRKSSSSSGSEVEMNQEELKGYLERWRAMDKDTRQMFYDYVRRSDFKLADVFRDMRLRGRLMDDFYREVMGRGDEGEF